MPGVVKGKDADLGLCRDGCRTIKRGRLSRIVALSKEAGLVGGPQ